MKEIIKAEGLSRFYGKNEVVKDVSFSIKTGESIGIIGPNGSGKTSLLEMLSGVILAETGEIYYKNKNTEDYSAKELAQSLAVLQQDALPMLDFTVRQVVKMGRYPYQNWLGEEKGSIEGFIDQILKKMTLFSLQDRELNQLSGGERQRVALAKVMVQEPSLVMLDEPTTYLDIGHQIQLMDQIRTWQKESNLTVISVLHDLNLAALYCEQLILMKEGKIIKKGKADEIIKKEIIEEVYGTSPIIVEHPSAKVPQIILERNTNYF
ncbi:MAG: ABC transporter ATP-binding protein [Atopostipes suicloacalis]|nr:ABC transporter ATP-binding protein [Atopostipes suicloacalis]MDN6731203.1 ABC transporter ATP-binding protein [Atopostipes suicloacalis]